MTLAGIKPGDIVRIAGSFALVIEKQRGKLAIRWIKSEVGARWVKATEIEAHWRRSKL